jgi:hypothetical protein
LSNTSINCTTPGDIKPLHARKENSKEKGTRCIKYENHPDNDTIPSNGRVVGMFQI